MVTWEAPIHPSRESSKHKGTAAGRKARSGAQSAGGGVRASEGTNPCTRPSFADQERVLMYYRIYPRVSEDHPDRSWMLQMGSLSPLSTTCTSRLWSFWNGRRS